MWRVPNVWEGGMVFIIGGGPSIAHQFNIPDEIVRGVAGGDLMPSEYSPYMESLHDKHTIGINAAYLLGDWIDWIFFGDTGFFLKHKIALSEYPGLKISSTPAVVKFPWVRFLKKDTKKTSGITDNPMAVSWNQNSGAAAISIARHTGAKQIVLLGFDMKLNESKQHWHNVYSSNTRERGKKPVKLPFERHLKGFPSIAADAKRMGIEILNASHDSAIDCFERVNIKDLL